MYPHSREYRGILPKEKIEGVVIAEFELPLNLQNIKEEVKLVPSKLTQHPFPHEEYILNLPREMDIPEFIINPEEIQLHKGDETWKLDMCYNWLHKPSQKSNFIKGTIYFRSQTFGNWEPFESVKYFVSERQDELEIPGQRIVKSVFPVELLDHRLFGSILEMHMQLDHFLIEESDEQEAVLMKHRAEMNNALLPTLPKSDLRIKVGNEEFFVHMKLLKAFSAVSEVQSKNFDGTNWDWSGKMTPDSIRGLLRFIYYDEAYGISTPEIAFHLLQFGHLYQEESLFKICILTMLTFEDSEYPFPEIFHMYLFVRLHVEFQELKKYFCGVLSRNVMEYDAKELKDLVQSTEGGAGVEALIEILQYEKPPEIEDPEEEEHEEDESEEEDPRIVRAY